MFMEQIKYYDVVKWKNPEDIFEAEDVMLATGGMGIYTEVTHLNEDGMDFVETVETEKLRIVGHADTYDKPEDVYAKYVR